MKSKKIIILFIMLVCNVSINAQIMQIMKGEKIVATYTASEADKVIFKESPTPSPANHEYIEIGGVKWATMNIGATTVAGSPSTCFGDYFTWGEIEPCYTSITIIDSNTIIADGWKSKYPMGYNDAPSYKGTLLDALHDAATQNWGEEWRTPTIEDFKALVTACGLGTNNDIDIQHLSSSNPTGGAYYLSSSQTFLPEYTSVPGVLFVDKQDNSKRLFFPAAGSFHEKDFIWKNEGSYWTSKLNANSKNGPTDAYCFVFYDSSYEEDFSEIGISCDSYEDYERGFTIRPVKK